MFQLYTLGLPFVSMTSVLNTYFNEVDSEDIIYEHFKHHFLYI